MIITLFLVILIVISVLALGIVLWRKLPHILVVDPSSSKAAKAKELKQDILRKRLERATAAPLATARDAVLFPWRIAQSAVRGFAGRLTALERTYAEKAKGNRKLDDTDGRRMLDDAEKALHAGRVDEAEKKLIELISINPKHVQAYEQLGRLYLGTKDYALARETFMHVLKLAPKDASVHASLGELCAIEGDDKKALDSFRKAKELSPNNPKYLDFFITAALQAGNTVEAKEALEKLKEVNPENQKIADFSAILQ
ncbi:MAG: tetratricopeptide repeat protein [Patescibacteria group bacterium]|jgi:Flp pilus assembly protein TadD